MFRSTVPPYVATINDDYHYEVWAVKQAEGESHASEELLGYVARHDDSVTVGFNNKLGEEVKRRLFSSLLLSKMNGHGRICIHRMTRQVHADLQSDIKKELSDRPPTATSEYFKGKCITVVGVPTLIDGARADMIEFYLISTQ